MPRTDPAHCAGELASGRRSRCSCWAAGTASGQPGPLDPEDSLGGDKGLDDYSCLPYRGGRKLIINPEGAKVPPRKPAPDETLIRALVKAHRWRRRIESGKAKSITDLAEQEGVTIAFVCRLLPLTCLAPDIVEAILDGRQPKGLRLAEMLGNGPLVWNQQRATWRLQLPQDG